MTIQDWAICKIVTERDEKYILVNILTSDNFRSKCVQISTTLTDLQQFRYGDRIKWTHNRCIVYHKHEVRWYHKRGKADGDITRFYQKFIPQLNELEAAMQQDVVDFSTSPNLMVGDYVVATKYSDGDPKDHFCVGFFSGMSNHNPPRYLIVNHNGVLYRASGFRRVQKISQELGRLIAERFSDIERSDISIWDWVTQLEQSTNL